MDKHFIVLCPGWIKTGGPEALHQLAFQLNEIAGVSCSILYYGKRSPQVIREYQALYPVPPTQELNQRGAHIVFPETFDPRHVPCPVGGSRWVWWLSANRYFPVNHYAGCGHLFQSEYARTKLLGLGVRGLMLTDYIRDYYLDEPLITAARHPWIAFNAAKSSLGALLLSRAQPFTLVPLRNMSAHEIRQTLSKCRIYMDFGTHPGRDRLPREAVLNGCMIVTGLEGAAGNKIDIPIPPVYKMSMGDLPQSTPRFNAWLDAYDHHIGDFHSYQQVVRTQKEFFRKEVASLVAAVELSSVYTRQLFIEPDADFFLLKQEILQREKDQMLSDLAASLLDESEIEAMQRVS